MKKLLILLVYFLFYFPLVAQAQDSLYVITQNELKELENYSQNCKMLKQKLKLQTQELNSQLSTAKESVANLNSQLQNQKQTMKKLQTSLNELENEKSEIQNRLNTELIKVKDRYKRLGIFAVIESFILAGCIILFVVKLVK